MEFDKITSRVAIAIPALHFATCTMYIYGYSSGFGGDIGYLFRVGDFFTIALQNLIQIYLFSLIWPAALIFSLHKFKLAGSVVYTKPVSGDKKFSPNSLIYYSHSALRAIMFLSFALGINILIDVFIYDWNFSVYFAIAFMQMILMSWVWKLVEKFKWNLILSEIALCLLTFSLSVISQGFDAGREDRRQGDISKFSDKMYCKDKIVLMEVGDNFIAVDRSGERFVINKECSTQFSFKKLPGFQNIKRKFLIGG